jgi:hypothetical protein
MSAILTLDERKPLSVSDFISAPANQRAEAFATITAYAGRYTFTRGEVVHHLEAGAMPNSVGTNLKRSVKLDGNQLFLLVAKPYLRGGIMVRSQELIWKRLKRASRWRHSAIGPGFSLRRGQCSLKVSLTCAGSVQLFLSALLHPLLSGLRRFLWPSASTTTARW